MKINYLIWVFVLFLLIGTVNALGTPSVLLPFENNLTNMGTASSTTFTDAGSGNGFSNLIYKSALGSYSLNLTGSGYVRSGTTPSGITTGNKNESFGGWFYLKALPTSGQNWILFWDGDVDTYEASMSISYHYSGAYYQFQVSGASSTSNNIFYNITLNTSQWYHVFVTYNSNKTKCLFINGIQTSCLTKSVNNNIQYPATGNTGRIVVGGYPHSSTNTNAYIDDFRYYDTQTLTASEVLEVYSGVSTIGINYNLTTPTNNTYYNSTHNYIEITTNTLYPNITNITHFLYLNDVLINYTNSTTGNFTTNFTGLSPGIYKINATVYNSTNSSSTETRTIYINKGLLNITLYNALNNSLINNWTVQISDLNESTIISNTTTSGLVQYFATLNNNLSLIFIINQGNFDSFTYFYSVVNFSQLLNFSIYPANAGTVYLIYEGNNSLFNCSGSGVFNLSSCRLYLGDSNVTVFDFKTNLSSNYSFDLNTQTKFRLELMYPSGDIITRYYDIDVVPDKTNIRLCANPINVTHYEMIIYSASQRGVNLINPFSNCLVGADYTRFAYQDAFILRTLTIDMPYYLYTVLDGVQSFLVGIDGSVESFINIDTLEFRSQAFDITIVSDSMTVYNNKSINTSIITYFNNADDNAQGNLTIYDAINNTLYLSSGLLFNPNNFTVLFDYSAINYTNQSLFKATFCYVKDNGDSDCDVVYFNLDNASDDNTNIPSPLAFMIAVCLIVFGFTLTQSKLSFSWFGIIMLLTALFVLSFSPITWYTKALMGLIVVYVVFIAFIMPSKARDTILG